MDSLENKIITFLLEFKSLYEYYSSGTCFIRKGKKYFCLMKRNYRIVKVDRNTLNVFPPSGKIPLGNLNNKFKGLDLFDRDGLIRNYERYKERVNELNYIFPIFQL